MKKRIPTSTTIYNVFRKVQYRISFSTGNFDDHSATYRIEIFRGSLTSNLNISQNPIWDGYHHTYSDAREEYDRILSSLLPVSVAPRVIYDLIEYIDDYFVGA